MADPIYNTPTVIAPAVPVTTAEAYSPTNVAQTLSNPAAKPDLSDPFATRAFYMESPEIKAAKAQAQKVMEEINASKQGLRTTTTALQNQNDNAQGGTGASINLIGRQVGRARELTSNELAALSENQLAAQSYLDTLTQDANAKYAIAESQRAQVQDLIRQTGGKAGISYADTYESAVAKADSYIKKQEKEAKKEAYKDSLKQQLLALGKNTKGLSTKELEKKLKKYNKNAIAEAKKQADAEWAMKVAQFNKSMAGGSGTEGQRAGSIVSSAQNALLASKGTDGKVDPGVYSSYRAKYASETGDVSGFDKQFGGLLSSSEQANLGIQTSTKPATAAQSLASGFATRLESSGSILDQFSGLGSSNVGTITGSGWFPNVLKSSERQQMEQAQRDFVNAQLRRESGAVISDSEFENAAQQYFPQPGDSQAVIEQKARSRAIAISNMKNAAGSAFQLGEQDVNDILSQFGIK